MLRNHPHRQEMARPRALARRVASAFTLLVLLGAGGLLNGGCASDKAVISQANQFHTGLQKAVMNDPTLDNYINDVGQRVVATAKQLDEKGYKPKSKEGEDNSWMFSDRMKFYFVNSKTLNAFTTGG